MKDLLKYFIICLASCLLGYIAGRCTVHLTHDHSEISVKNDSLIFRDTVREIFPMVVDVTIAENEIEVPVADIVIHSDSLVVLPMEVKTYEGEGYRAIVSGYRPSLDSIYIYPETRLINTTQTISVPSRQRWGFGVQAGYGAHVHGGRIYAAPYVGVGISYNLIRW